MRIMFTGIKMEDNYGELSSLFFLIRHKNKKGKWHRLLFCVDYPLDCVNRKLLDLNIVINWLEINSQFQIVVSPR